MATDEQFKKLRTDAWRTTGARYNAARRLRQRETFSSASLALFSALIIVVSLIQALYATSIVGGLGNALTALTASFGMFALVISLVEAGAKSGERASRLFINAENLNDFQKRMEIANPAQLGLHFAEYKTLKDALGDNHEPIDDEYFVSRHPAAPEFLHIKRRSPFWVAVVYRFASIWHLVAIWLVFAVCLGLVFRLLPVTGSGCGEQGAESEVLSRFSAQHHPPADLSRECTQ